MRNQHTRFRRFCRRCGKGLRAYWRREGRLCLWFASSLVGVLAKGFFDAHRAGRAHCAGRGYRLCWPHVVMALVATLITFQATFERYAEVQADAPLLVQVSLAFQAGFFWQTVFNDLTAVP